MIAVNVMDAGISASYPIGRMMLTIGHAAERMFTTLYNHFTGHEEISYVEVVLRMLLFVLLEAGVYYIGIFKANKKNGLYYCSLIVLCILPFSIFVEQLAATRQDLIMRVSIPLLTVLLVMVIQYFASNNNKIIKTYLFVVLLIGSISSVMCWTNVIQRTLEGAQKEVIAYNNVLCGSNFSGEAKGIFFEKMSKDLENNGWRDILIEIPQEKATAGVIVSGIPHMQDNGGWIADRCVVSIDGYTNSAIKASFVSSYYGDIDMKVRVNGNEIGSLAIEGENKDKELETVRSIIIPAECLNEEGQFVEVYCDAPQSYYVNDDNSSTISMFVKQIEFNAIEQ